jgi:hypothetical protein
MRIYAITFKLHSPSKYSVPKNEQEEILCYTKFERDNFIKKFLYLTDDKRDSYVTDVKCYYGELEEINDMKSIIEAI